MFSRRRFTVALGAAMLLLGLARPSAAAGRGHGKPSHARPSHGKGKASHGKPGRADRRHKRGRHKPRFEGHGVAAAELRQEPVPRPSGNIWVFAGNLGEEVKVNIFGADGQFDDAALASLDHGFRCRRTNEERAVDPRLYQTLSTIEDHFGGKRIELVSGFRFQRDEGSRHFHASAMDIRIPGVSLRELYEYAESLDTGGMGMGIYPRSDFVHIDWRAPGEPSYRWTDYATPDGDSPNKRPSLRWKRPST